MRAKLLVSLSAAILAASPFWAQAQAPVVVQAASPATAPPPAAITAAQSEEGTLKLLHEIKAANDAVLSKQAATLQRLDELEKAAEQIKIYSKRG